MNGRVYDYNLARFMSVDPFVHGGSQGLNPYSYIFNNPLSGTDPSGYTPEAANTEQERKMTVTTAGSRIKRTVTVTATEASSGAAMSVNVTGGSNSAVRGAMTSLAGSIGAAASSSVDIGSQAMVAAGETGTQSIADNQESPITAATDEIDIDTLFEQLDFDPDGSDRYTAAILNPIDALRANAAGEEAEELTREAYPNIRIAWNNEADAFRHAVWNFLMASRIGEEAAKELADAYEVDSGNPLSETAMDLFNNEVGRRLGSNPNFQAEDATVQIMKAIDEGRLRTAPFQIKEEGESVEQDY